MLLALVSVSGSVDQILLGVAGLAVALVSAAVVQFLRKQGFEVSAKALARAEDLAIRAVYYVEELAAQRIKLELEKFSSADKEKLAISVLRRSVRVSEAKAQVLIVNAVRRAGFGAAAKR